MIDPVSNVIPSFPHPHENRLVMKRVLELIARRFFARRCQTASLVLLSQGIFETTRRQILKLLLVVTVFSFGGAVSLAWNDAGHMTITRLAWDELTVDERESVTEIISHHPHREALLQKDKPAEASEHEWMFLRGAVWSDYVRPPKTFPREEVATHPLFKYHRGPWHYVNFPYTVGQISHEIPERHLPDETNILNELELTMKIIGKDRLNDPSRVANITVEQNRAVRLTWLLHLVGDLHQPLHVIALVDRDLFPEPPHTDQGGNRLSVRTDSSSLPKNLHWIWDEMFSVDSRFEQVQQQAERLSHDPVLREEIQSELTQHRTFREWAAESYRTAITHAYLDGKLELARVEPVGPVQDSASTTPIVHAVAMQQARQIAQRRVLLAGRRLAAKLKELTSK